jgi:hypothetical protein
VIHFALVHRFKKALLCIDAPIEPADRWAGITSNLTGDGLWRGGDKLGTGKFRPLQAEQTP